MNFTVMKYLEFKDMIAKISNLTDEIDCLKTGFKDRVVYDKEEAESLIQELNIVERHLSVVCKKLCLVNTSSQKNQYDTLMKDFLKSSYN